MRGLIRNLFLIFFAIIILGTEACFAEQALTKKEQDIVKISSLAATGNLIGLNNALNKALDDKMTIYEVKEVLVQLCAYCGFPRSINALTVFMNVTDERSSNGKYDEYGTEPVDMPPNSNKYEIGNAVQTELVGAPVTGRIYEFEPAIDKYLKEHLFADIFARGVLTYEEREIATMAALASVPEVEPQLNAHIQIAKNIGIPQNKIDEILKLTGYKDKATKEAEKKQFKNIIFDKGQPNNDYALVFTGQSYLNRLSTDGVNITNVTFEPKCRNNWHIHHKGGQILLVTQGRGYYQEWGHPAVEVKAGDVVNIPPEVKHWHGAAKDSWFVHITVEVPAKNSSTEWLEPVSDTEYNKLP